MTISSTIRIYFSVIAVALALHGCASVEPTNPKLDEARAAYQSAASDPYTAKSGAIPLQRAQEALQQAEYAQREGKDPPAVDHYAYLAKQRALTAQEIGKQAAAQETVENTAKERDQILLQSRTQEAEIARQSAEQQRMAASQAEQAAEQQRIAAEQARREALETQAIAEQRAREAEQARNQAQTAEQQAAALQAQLSELQAKPTERGMVLTLGDVLFDTGKSTLKPGALRTLDKLASFLQKNPEQKIRIEGHTDSVGSEESNIALSQRRADAVRQALFDKGVSETQMEAIGLGEAYPVASNNTKAGKQQNRRVEVLFLNTEEGAPNRP